MDFRKMEAFLAIAQSGQFTTAAEKLFVSQSSLSKQMKQLEDELQVRLFKKTRSGVQLTQAGWEFYAYARRVLPEYQATISNLRKYNDGQKDVMRLGLLPLTGEYGLEDAILSFWAEHPKLQIEYHERNQADILSKLARCQIDLALVRIDALNSDDLMSQKVLADEIVVVCRDNNPLASHRTTTVNALRNERFALLDHKSALTQRFLNACKKEGFQPNVEFTHARHRMLLKAVQKRMGCAVLPRRLLASAYAPDLVGIPFDPPIYSMLGFVWNASKELRPAEREFIDYIIQSAGPITGMADGDR